jgi:hypothetical protein
MGHAGPPSSSLLGGGANPNSEQPPLTIRVACEGEDCNALLEVNMNLAKLLIQRKRQPAVLAWPPKELPSRFQRVGIDIRC